MGVERAAAAVRSNGCVVAVSTPRFVRVAQEISTALVGEVLQADRSAARAEAAASLNIFGQSFVEVFGRIKLARVRLHFRRDDRMMLLRDGAELFPIEPRRGDVTHEAE